MKNSPATRQQSKIRIIGGIWRNRSLPVLDFEGLRPTPNRVKETVFNWLMNYVVDANCLDCFAGTGSLGFEALSRYANSTVFLEKNRFIAKQLNDNIATLQVANATVITTDSIEFLSHNKNRDKFNIVFLDPPFNKDILPNCIKLLHEQNWLENNAIIYIESELDFSINQNITWKKLKEKISGQVKYQLFVFN